MDILGKPSPFLRQIWFLRPQKIYGGGRNRVQLTIARDIAMMFYTATSTVYFTGTLVAWCPYPNHPELPSIRRFASNALGNSCFQISHARFLSPKFKPQRALAPRLKSLGSELPSELEPSSSSSDENDEPNGSSIMEATFDLKLPRRNLMVQFTCNACGERTHRTINRVAYEQGTVFLQCGGCQQYHKFVDNLGLVV